ncbi:MAG: hypothetical protein LLG93_05420, partial [Deltaproteobacteria bacterium]|nr:hypothetical protein [Deltaproteobacteria bacterium]
MRKIVEIRKDPADPAFRDLLDRCRRGEGPVTVGGLEGSARALVLSLLFVRLGRPFVVISPTEKEAGALQRDLTFFLGEEQVLGFPPWDLLTTDMFAFQRETELTRLEALHRLAYGGPAVVVIPAPALMQKLIPRGLLEGYVEEVSLGDTRERDALVRKLSEGGYGRVTLVEGKGEFSVRGNVVDLFPPHVPHPLRLEFFGDELESIREFDESSQRSIRELAEFQLFPAREVILTPESRERAVRNVRRRSNDLGLSRGTKEKLAEMIGTGLGSAVNPLFHPLFYNDPGEAPFSQGGLGTLFDYLPAGAPLILDDPLAIRQTFEKVEKDLDGFLLRARDSERFYLEKGAAYLTAAMVMEGWHSMRPIRLEGLGLEEGGKGPDVRFTLEPVAAGPADGMSVSEEGLLRPLVEKIGKWIGEGNRVVWVCAGQEGLQRMAHLLSRYDLQSRRMDGSFIDWIGDEVPAGLFLRDGRVSGGVRLAGMRLVILAEEEIFGKKALRRRVRPAREGYFLKSFGELSAGDFVVHTEHGIGRYQGLQKLAVNGIENDFLLIAYQDQDRLYLPVERIDQIQRYIGPDGFVPKVDRLGGTSWEAVKERVKTSVREMAEELVAIYAAREVMSREA